MDNISPCEVCVTKECGLIDGQECNEFWNYRKDKSRMNNVCNAHIKKVSLGYEDHGILTFGLTLNISDGTSCVFGGYELDTYDKTTGKRECQKYSMELITEIMKTVGVKKWEDLIGKYIRVITEGCSTPIRKIGNLMEDKWFDIDKFFEFYNIP